MLSNMTPCNFFFISIFDEQLVCWSYPSWIKWLKKKKKKNRSRLVVSVFLNSYGTISLCFFWFLQYQRKTFVSLSVWRGRVWVYSVCGQAGLFPHGVCNQEFQGTRLQGGQPTHSLPTLHTNRRGLPWQGTHKTI